MKTPRFVKEFAAWQRAWIKENELMQAEYKEKALARIDRVMKLLEMGCITIGETVEMLNNPLDGIAEKP